jgi:hypothetical protein
VGERIKMRKKYNLKKLVILVTILILCLSALAVIPAPSAEEYEPEHLVQKNMNLMMMIEMVCR